MTLIYITCKDKAEAKKISKALLEKKLIACSNMFPIESMYWWKGKIEESKEFLIIAKTNDVNYDKIKAEVKKLHSYDVPCILKIEGEANKAYDDWIRRVIE